jgi:hypothetical protein
MKQKREKKLILEAAVRYLAGETKFKTIVGVFVASSLALTPLTPFNAYAWGNSNQESVAGLQLLQPPSTIILTPVVNREGTHVVRFDFCEKLDKSSESGNISQSIDYDCRVIGSENGYRVSDLKAKIKELNQTGNLMAAGIAATAVAAWVMSFVAISAAGSMALAGGSGTFFGGGILAKVGNAIMSALGLSVLYIGNALSLVMGGSNAAFVAGLYVGGAIVGGTTFVGVRDLMGLVNPYTYWTPASELDDYLKFASARYVVDTIFTNKDEGRVAADTIGKILSEISAYSAPNQGFQSQNYPPELRPTGTLP